MPDTGPACLTSHTYPSLALSSGDWCWCGLDRAESRGRCLEGMSWGGGSTAGEGPLWLVLDPLYMPGNTQQWAKQNKQGSIKRAWGVSNSIPIPHPPTATQQSPWGSEYPVPESTQSCAEELWHVAVSSLTLPGAPGVPGLCRAAEPSCQPRGLGRTPTLPFPQL